MGRGPFGPPWLLLWGLPVASTPQIKTCVDMDSEAQVALEVWSRLLISTPFCLSMTPAAHVEVTAMDAMASQTLADLGGAAFFPAGSAVWY